MKKIMTKGILISSVVLFSIILIIIPSNVYADEVNVKSFSLEETAILQITNNSNENIDTFRIWLGGDFNFKSFKTEKGWLGEKTPQGVVVFKSSKSLISGETVKFGIKTDKTISGINWKALNSKNEQLDIGKVLLQEIPKVGTNNTIDQSTSNEIKSKSVIKIIPEKPNINSHLRIIGNDFEANMEFELYIDKSKIDNVVTNDKGNFITTIKIPEDQKPGRTNLRIVDESNKEKEISIKIGELDNRIPKTDNSKLSIQGIPKSMFIGEFLDIYGTALPNNTITVNITNSKGDIVNTSTIKTNHKGDWRIKEPFVIPTNWDLGKYNIIISDGRENAMKSWSVESNKTMSIIPSKNIFQQGEIMIFDGIVLPNMSVEVIISDPLENEIFTKYLQVDQSGIIKFEFQTNNTHNKGTYTITTTQGTEKNNIYVGLDQPPIHPIKIEFDKTRYDSNDIVNIELSGESNEIINLLVIDPSDIPINELDSIKLQQNGKATFQLDLKGYKSGIYTIQISKGNYQNMKTFAVGLQTGSGEIKINATKSKYVPGEQILLIGKTSENILLQISLADPDGNIIKEKETFSDKNGIISDSSFRIPNESIDGIWKMNVKSGSNFSILEIRVLKSIEEGMEVSIEEGGKITGVGNTLTIKISGAKQTTIIQITDSEGALVETLSLSPSDQGEIDIPWIIPKNIELGTYTITIDDAHSVIQQTFEIK
jgi:hypothetical protein